MKRDERGVALVLEILVALIVLGAIGFVGYKVMQSRDKSSPNANQSSESESSEKALEWTKGGIAVSGKYADAHVLNIDDTTWRMYFASQPEGGKLEIYSATSKDGKTWTQDAGVRKSMATFPNVVKLSDGRYRLYFQSGGVIKSAISTDGLSFADETGTRIDLTNAENLTFDNVAAPSVIKTEDGLYTMIYRGTMNQKYTMSIPTPNQTTSVLMWATSSDGLSFTKKGIAVDSRNDVLAGQLDGPDLVTWDEGSLKIFATTYAGVFVFDFKDGKVDEGTLAYAAEAKRDNMGFHGQPPGDPTVAEINGTWYMYFGQDTGIHYAVLAQ